MPFSCLAFRLEKKENAAHMSSAFEALTSPAARWSTERTRAPANGSLGKIIWEPSTGICSERGADSCSDLCRNCSTRIVWAFGGGGDERHGLRKRGLRRRTRGTLVSSFLWGLGSEGSEELAGQAPVC